MNELNLLGIDFEEWYHPELVQPHIKDDEKKPQVFNGIDKILDWLKKNDTFATFFTVGEILEAYPEILDKIIENGHEIAFHTMHHKKMDTTTKEEFSQQIQDFAKMTNKRSRGFRAPTFSLNRESSWLIDVLEENEYLYDSSIVPAKTTMYGIPDAPETPYRITSNSIEKNDPSGKIIEFPLSITKILGKRIPTAGGFYLRILPLSMVQKTIEQYEKNNMPTVFYIHSWELTPELMPRISLPIKQRFVTYHNLDKAFPRMDKLIKKYEFTSFEKYLDENKFRV